jgi:hypothetical protein
MDHDTRLKLLAADKPLSHKSAEVYSGGDLDFEDAFQRGRLVQRDLKEMLGEDFEFSDDQQDAFFWGGVYQTENGKASRKYRVVIRFSFCGNLAATWTIDDHESMPDKLKQDISRILKKHGFNWVDGDELKKETYDGVYEYFKTHHYNAPASWWDRFFEYD